MAAKVIAAKRMERVKHNKKGQVDMMGVQLVDDVEEIDRNTRELLAEPGHGVPSVSLVTPSMRLM